MKIELVDDWRDFWRWWSVRLNLIGALLWGVLETGIAEHFLSLWGFVPGDSRAMLPEWLRSGAPLLFFGMALFARVAKQRVRK